MRRIRTSGLTIAELLIAFVLVLLLLLYTLSSFVTSNNYIKRNKEYSTALFLSQTKMEELQVTPFTDIEPVSDTAFEAPFEEYKYRINFEIWEGELWVLEVVVISPRGAIARVRTLRQSQTFNGVIADPATNFVAFTKPSSDKIHYWNEDPSAAPRLTESKPLANGELGALAGHPGSNLLWAVNLNANTIAPYLEEENDPWGAQPTLTWTQGAPRLAGAAMDEMGNIVFCADWSNRGLWVYTDGLPGFRPGFLGNRPHAPVSPPLGIPAGVATDPAGSLVIVADTENQCLRKLFVDLSDAPEPPLGYDNEQLEYDQGLGYWLKDRLRHPKGMGAPQGVAMNSSGWGIYTIDRAYLYILEEEAPDNPNWRRVPLDPALTSASPSGLALDEFNNLLFITAKNGELWKLNLDGTNFERLDPPSGA